MSILRAYRRFNAGDSRTKRALLMTGYWAFIVWPYPARRRLIAGYISVVLWFKRLARVESQDELTPLDEVGTLSFWRVPAVDLETYTLTVDGAVESPVLLSFDEVPLATDELVTTQYAGFGVTFTNLAYNPSCCDFDFPGV